MATHETLIETHDVLKEAHTSLHSLVHEPIARDNIAVTCDILYDSTCPPSTIIVMDTNTFCSLRK